MGSSTTDEESLYLDMCVENIKEPVLTAIEPKLEGEAEKKDNKIKTTRIE